MTTQRLKNLFLNDEWGNNETEGDITQDTWKCK